MTRLLLSFVLLASSLLAQVTPQPGTAGQLKIGCTPDSMAAASAGSLAARELGRWNCYAYNISPTAVKLSQVAFALEFMELHQISQADVTDIFTTKQKMTKAAKAVRILELVGMAAVMVMGQSFIQVDASVVSAIALGGYGSGKLVDFLGKQVPPTSNALAGQWEGDSLTLAPGEGKRWKVYASKMRGAKELGPKIITLTSVVTAAPSPVVR